jgi:hypothetical protein
MISQWTMIVVQQSTVSELEISVFWDIEWKAADISEECISSIFKVEEEGELHSVIFHTLRCETLKCN